jgi:predicted branched-subunit amino acid permease
MFVGLLVPSMKKSTKAIYLAGVAAVFNTIFTFAELLSTGWAIVLATILSALIIEAVESFKTRKVKGGKPLED